ncbi:MAG: hypothetical protein EOP85_02320 [Verrucomicrobiaceae bacterium]|nr:MAG: hypothetical protein EOP85_02320 [Verrucomicrobiaceae bacterium]
MRYLLILLLTVSAHAQTRQVSLRLLAFDGMNIPPESFAFDPAAPPGTAGVKAPVKGYLNHEVTKVILSGSKVVFAKTANPEDLKKPEMVLADVNLPRAGTRFMLIFLPKATGEVGYQVMPLDDSVKDFPLGSYRIINLSRFPVKLNLQDKSFEYKAGDSKVIENPPVGADKHSAMYAFSMIDGKWARIGANTWPHPGKKRSVQMFFDNPDTKRTELRGFRDISPPVPGQQQVATSAGE